MQDLASRQQQVMAYVVQIAQTVTSDSCKLRRFLWRYERTQDNQDDIIQDAMLEAVRCSDRYLALASVQTWFYGVVANVARNHVARRVNQTARTESLEFLRDLLDEFPENDWMHNSCQSAPNEGAGFRELAAQLHDAMGQLPTDLRKTFEMVCLQEHSYRDTAKILSIPIGTVRSRINRARFLLRRRLNGH